MPTEMTGLAHDVLEDVRAACEKSGRQTTEAEVARALEPLTPDELDRVRRLARQPLQAKPLSPDALVDIMRGLPAAVAAARELGGYYTLKAERDALERITRGLSAPAPAPKAEPAPAPAPTIEPVPAPTAVPPIAPPMPVETRAPAPASQPLAAVPPAPRAPEPVVPPTPAPRAPEPVRAPPAPVRARAPVRDEDDEIAPPDALVPEPGMRNRRFASHPEPKPSSEQQQALLTLFAYHRDAVRVAQELGIGILELNDRIEELGLKRRIHRLLEQTTDIDVFTPGPSVRPAGTGQPPAPVVRRRGERPQKPPAFETTQEREEPPEEETPVPDTSPVTPHGTRVYRRQPTDERERRGAASDDGLAPRREYVRETRQRAAKPRVQEALPPRPAKAPEPVAPARRPYSDLQSTLGRTVLEKLLADEKANPRVLAGRLAERFQGPAERELHEGDLRQLLQHHGLADTFAERERANTRFLIGFHQGARGKLANALQMQPAELTAYLQRLGLLDELERVRAERSRIELGRKKISDRITQVLTRAPYLDDLGVLPVIDREVKSHLEMLFSGRPVNADEAEQVRSVLGLEKNAFAKLLRRYDMASRLGEET